MTPEELRIQWMTEWGLDMEEIQYHLQDDPPTSTEEEQKQLEAVRRLKENSPSCEELKRIATKY
jgi:hypothetical protein